MTTQQKKQRCQVINKYCKQKKETLETKAINPHKKNTTTTINNNKGKED